MDEKTVVIQNHLLNGLLGRNIIPHHAGTGALYKFRIEGEPTHWFYVSYELVSDSAPVSLVNLINFYRVVETLNAATQSRWLFMNCYGLHEVDESFARNQ